MGYIIKLSLENLKQRKLRTALTITGIMIGIMSILTMLTAGMGAKKTMIEEVEKSGNTREIYVSSANSERYDMIITDAVIKKLEKLDKVTGVYPVLRVPGQQKMGTYIGFSDILGVPEEYMEMLPLQEGKKPSSEGIRPELLAGKGVRDSLYNVKTWIPYAESDMGEKTLAGKKIDLEMQAPEESEDEKKGSDKATDTDAGAKNEEDDKQEYIRTKLKIVGETDNEYDYNFYTDIDMAKLFLKKNYDVGNIPNQPKDKNGNPYSVWVYDRAIVRVESVDDVENVSKIIKDMGFQVQNNLEMLNTVNRTIGLVQLILGAVGSIAAVVAIIGIVNTMMTAVYDRVQEIGLLKMLGADSDDITYMFLFESSLFGMVGGVLGIGLSLLADYFINGQLVKLLEMPEGTWIMTPPLWLVVLTLFFSVLVSVLAGIIPARWAAHIKPLEAIS